MGRFALIIVMALFLFLTYFVISTQSSTSVSHERNIDSKQRNDAKNIANSAAQLAIEALFEEIFEISDGEDLFFTTGNDNFAYWPALEGSYRIRAVRQGTTIQLTSSGKAGQPGSDNPVYDIFVSLTIQQDGSSEIVFDNAVFSEGSIDLTGSGQIFGNVGTNSTGASTVNFGWSTYVHGNFAVGTGSDYNSVITSAGSGRTPHDNISGLITPLPEPRAYPLPEYPTFPSGLADRGNFSTPWTASLYYPITEDGHYVTIEATASRTITIDMANGNRILRVGNLNISQGTVNLINVAPESRLYLYVENNFTLGGSSTFNNNGESKHVHMYYSGTSAPNIGGNTRYKGSMYIETADFEIAGSNGVLGHIISGGSNVTVSGNAETNVRVLYAPNAHVKVTGSGRVRGAVVSSSLSVEGNGRIYFDDDFEDPIIDLEETEGDGASEVKVLNWN